MLFSKRFMSFFVLCFVQQSLSKPTANYLSEGRGIGSTVWGWITYPFSWWSSSDPDQPPVNDQLVGSTYGPYDNIEIGKHNVTVWCNDQTCTTMKCDKYGCKNVTCNIYDTDMSGACREYNTVLKPEEPISAKPTVPATSTLQDKISESTKAPEITSVASTTSTQNNNNSHSTDERPLELEAVLSSTVTEENAQKGNIEEKENKSSPKNKV